MSVQEMCDVCVNCLEPFTTENPEVPQNNEESLCSECDEGIREAALRTYCREVGGTP